MYILEVKACPDTERLGEYSFYFPIVKISRLLSSSHLYLPDPSIGKSVLILKEQSDGLLVWEQSGAFYLHNGKKNSGKKLVRSGDTIGIGESQIQLLSHTPSEASTNTESRYHELTEKSPYMADLFWALKQEMLFLEKEGKL